MPTTSLVFPHPAWIEIDLRQFKKNIKILQQFLGATKICFPIKANSYGHGLVPMARAAAEAGIDYLGVSCLQEAALLREAGIKTPIFVMGAIHEAQIPALLNYDIEISISSRYKAQLLAKKCEELNKTAKVHIEIDTGMQRTGVRPETAVELLHCLQAMPQIQIVGVYTHLATGDMPESPIAYEQITQFKKFIETHIDDQAVICHVANSGGVCHFPEACFDMVRPGLLLLGYSPSKIAALQEIKPFFSVKAKIAYFKVVAQGQGIGYGHTYHAKTATRVVTVPVGYGDGYRRALSNIGQVLIGGNLYPIAGTVCMDQFMVDIGNDAAYVGDEVVLIGQQGDRSISLLSMAELCQTIPYEILCGFNDRLPRLYFDDEQA